MPLPKYSSRPPFLFVASAAPVGELADADADQAEPASVRLAAQKVVTGAKDPVGKLGRRRQAAGPGQRLELGVSGRVFTDVGSAGAIATNRSGIEDTGSLRAAAGFGITWKSPFGPLGLDFGIPIVKESFDETEIVRINFGTRF